MEKLKFGIEIEGAIKDINFEMAKTELEREYNLNSILISKMSDYSAKINNIPAGHVDRRELKSRKPILHKDIKNHIKHWELLLDRLDFIYNPRTCGLHIHTSPIHSNWTGNFSKYMFNLYFSLSPFVRFFKNRREQRYCLGNGKYSKLMRFFTEDVNTDMNKNEFKDKWKSAIRISEFGFSARNMLRITDRLDTIEIRLFPPEIKFLDTLIKLVSRIWEVEEVLNPNRMIEKSLFDVLKMYDLQEDLYKFKNYYEEWIK